MYIYYIFDTSVYLLIAAIPFPDATYTIYIYIYIYIYMG